MADLASSIFWMVIPSLVFFISLPLLLKKGLAFYPSMGIALSMTAACYALMMLVLTRFGVKF